METPYREETFESLGVARDIDIAAGGAPIAWTHRKLADADVYFISNQQDKSISVPVSFRVTGLSPELWNPVSGKMKRTEWEVRGKGHI
ncbi:hypothetical protein LWM68_23695 [Niabella sp. W65]|nr:hypothetical protein [Niabella sp. W65]MCH7365509.1 hypothetical protein [Niabella sp. W65]